MIEDILDGLRFLLILIVTLMAILTAILTLCGVVNLIGCVFSGHVLFGKYGCGI